MKKLLLIADAYKYFHKGFYPEKTTYCESTWTPRSFKYCNVAEQNGYMIHYGTKYMLSRLKELTDEFFNSPLTVIEEEEFKMLTGNETTVNFEDFKKLHDLGYLPLEIKSIPEGAKAYAGTPVLTVSNTHPDFFWIVNFFETWMSQMLWQASTSATLAESMHKIVMENAEETCDNLDHIPFICHDFSSRGMSSPETSIASGLGHLAFFDGSDNARVAYEALKIYNKQPAKFVPATEHAVMCADGKENEKVTIERIIDSRPEGFISIVSDSWNYWDAINEIYPSLKKKIMMRDGKVIIRPDSGNPIDILTGSYGMFDSWKPKQKIEEYIHECIENKFLFEPGETEIIKHGDYFYKISCIGEERDIDFSVLDWNNLTMEDLEELGTLEILKHYFGGKVNDKGYFELDRHIGIIYGDAMTPESIRDILDKMKKMGFSGNNIVFGIGSYTYQYNTRDTLGFAIKLTYIEVDGESRMIVKEPITDSGKTSQKGLTICKQDELGIYYGIDKIKNRKDGKLKEDEKEIIYKNGEII